ncbi:MAG: 2Fe-2S iron-sulfur cluster binding domain-containing protein [Theionarchaea archaeon]|nr:2Fe-2S iron-sulfur cluster binding domain-containing protein [Theionarchaea archaeon]
MDTSEKAYLEIFRFNPELNLFPEFQRVTIPFQEHATVLEALRYIYEHVDPSLAFRESCKAGLCGLCAVQVNGKVCLACSTYMKKTMRIGPVPKFKVIRDLVVDYSHQK